MLALPPVDPVVGWRFNARLARDHYLRCDGNDYSVHPSVIGRRVELTADLEQVVVTCDGVEVARHQRCWARHQSITDPAHAAAAARLRAVHPARTRAGRDPFVEHRDLADYDRIFGLTGPAGTREPGDMEQVGAVSA